MFWKFYWHTPAAEPNDDAELLPVFFSFEYFFSAHAERTKGNFPWRNPRLGQTDSGYFTADAETRTRTAFPRFVDGMVRWSGEEFSFGTSAWILRVIFSKGAGAASRATLFSAE